MRQDTEVAYERLFSPDRHPLAGIPFDGPHLLERMREYEAASERLQALLIVGAAWGEPQQLGLWQRSLTRIATPPPPPSGTGYSDAWENARAYPIVRLLYASSLAAIAHGRFDNLYGMLEAPVADKETKKKTAMLLAVNTISSVEPSTLNAGLSQRYKVPMSEYFYSGLRDALREHLASEAEYESAFDLLEYLWALAYVDQDPDQTGWCRPVGRFVHRGTSRIRKESSELGESWPPLRAGFFGGSLERLKAAEEQVTLAQKRRLGW